MKTEDFKIGLPVMAHGRKGHAVEIERCNGNTFVIHIAFTGQESQWRVPIEQVEVRR